MVERVEIGEAATVYLGDWREIVPALTQPVAAVITDPPYGQQQNTNVVGPKGLRTYRNYNAGAGLRVVDSNARARVAAGGLHSTRQAVAFPEGIAGDAEAFDPTRVLAIAPRTLLWGAHRFADRLPPGSWLVWDKVPTGKVRDQGDGEAAWVNDDPPRPLRIHRLLWDGVCVGSAARDEVTAGQSRVHPMQKPVQLMQWCIQMARVPAGGLILDPYAGAGSTGIAAMRLGHPFIGIEIEPFYFETMCKRLLAAYQQPALALALASALAPCQEQLAMFPERHATDA